MLAIFASLAFFAVLNANPEERVIKDLLDKYEASRLKYARPVANYRDVVNVSLGLTLVHITGMDLYKGLMHSNVWLMMMWKDINLKWNKTEYGGVEKILLPVDKIWKPDFAIFNKGYSGGFGSTTIDQTAPVIVKSCGTVIWIPQASIISLIGKNQELKEGNTLHCPITIGSWAHSGFKMNLTHFNPASQKASLEYYHPNPRYTIVGNEAVKHKKYYPCCKEPYYHMDFNLKIKLNDDDDDNDSKEPKYTAAQSADDDSDEK